MKFPFDKTVEKDGFGVKILEDLMRENLFSIRYGIAYFRNDEYPCKINSGMKPNRNIDTLINIHIFGVYKFFVFVAVLLVVIYNHLI